MRSIMKFALVFFLCIYIFFIPLLANALEWHTANQKTVGWTPAPDRQHFIPDLPTKYSLRSWLFLKPAMIVELRLLL